MSNGSTTERFPHLSPREGILENIRALENCRLDEESFSYPTELFRMLDAAVFVELCGTLFETLPDKKREVTNLAANHLTAIHGLGLPLIYIVVSSGWQKRVLFGTTPEGIEPLRSMLSGVFGAELVGKDTIRFQPPFAKAGCGTITGIPDISKFGPQFNRQRQVFASSIDNLMSVLQNDSWMYAALSIPEPRAKANIWFAQCAGEIQRITESHLLTDIQKADRLANLYIKGLEKTTNRLKSGFTEGLWGNGIYFLTPEKVEVGLSLLLPIFSGERSQPEPIRGALCQAGGSIYPFTNLLTSQELSCYLRVPEREYQGFRLKERVHFDIDYTHSDCPSVPVGRIMTTDRVSDQSVAIDINELTKHGLVAGATGSGKTNTLFSLLSKLWRDFRIPFMVLEPTKAEYRSFSKSLIPEILVFTLGEETPGSSSPFRLNPFQFPEGVSLQSHISYLSAVFNASFVMYSPMPYVLEECLHEIYRDKGWVLISSKNKQGKARGAYPTLTDLYNKIDEVVDRLGYEARITMDIKSALKTRINNLRIGGKGLMLDTPESIFFENLMNMPVVLELKYMGNDDEKTFVMGLVLTALYEHYEAGAFVENSSHKLKHLTLIEEAHRLLKNVPTEKASEDASNMKGKAVETFCNILSEIRAYGEGVLVAEQIPSKLAPDILKNTNFKVLHRIVSKEEREVIGHTMNLDEAQLRHVATLNQGEAVFFREGFDRPYLIKVDQAAIETAAGAISSQEIHKKMLSGFYKTALPLLFRYPYCRSCSKKFTADCAQILMETDDYAEHFDLTTEAVRYYAPLFFAQEIPGNKSEFMKWAGKKDPVFSFCCEARLTSCYLEKTGTFYGVQHDTLNEIFNKLSIIKDSGPRRSELKKCVESITERGKAPFLFCHEYCAQVCRYGSDVKIIGKNAVIHNAFIDFLENPDPVFMGGESLPVVLSGKLANFFSLRPEDIPGRVILCYAIQKMAALGIAAHLQKIVLDHLLQRKS